MKLPDLGGRKLIAFFYTQTILGVGLFTLYGPEIKAKIVSGMVFVLCGYLGVNFGGKIVEKIKSKIPGGVS